MRYFVRHLTVLAMLLASGLAARADYFFVIVYGAESKPQRPKYSHSWATFVHVPDAQGCPAEWFTISWLNCDGALQPLRLLPEPGRNWGLHETFASVYSYCENVDAFGPYQICPDLYCRAFREKQR